MRLSDNLPKGESKYLRADDLDEGTEVRVTIEQVQVESIEHQDDNGNKEVKDRNVAYFKGKEKGLVLNQTNGKKLIEAFGDSLESQQGQEILLYRDTVDFKGQTVPCLRLRIPTQEVAADDVPF